MANEWSCWKCATPQIGPKYGIGYGPEEKPVMSGYCWACWKGELPLVAEKPQARSARLRTLETQKTESTSWEAQLEHSMSAIGKVCRIPHDYKDCSCVTHQGPHWLHMAYLDWQRNIEMLEKGGASVLPVYCESELYRVRAMKAEMLRAGWLSIPTKLVRKELKLRETAAILKNNSPPRRQHRCKAHPMRG